MLLAVSGDKMSIAFHRRSRAISGACTKHGLPSTQLLGGVKNEHETRSADGQTAADTVARRHADHLQSSPRPPTKLRPTGITSRAYYARH